uniref:NADH-ubiquinone oxidoreductase chain 2 n=1 Tax=Sillaginopsis panijus TaxID=270580 RepID=A0A679EVL2_9TELE|nr:NADH dehydrogenase subunit 2 [Sillaginopsis panijus]BBU25931.1 NADH dehydrogenase subunit 2 [Sillaginopsis panijus]
MNPYVLTTMLMGLGIGTTMTFASSHWLLAWMGLEINTLSIIPLMTLPHHPRAVEAATKYFLIQATAAAVILFASVTNAWFTGQWEILQMSHPVPLVLVTLALALKIGLAPLHSWLPEVLQGLTLTTGLVLSTWQKLAPFAILLQIQHSTPHIMIILGLLSILVGGWGGLNQTQLRKILAYSSIAHLGWMALVLQFYPTLALLALALYLVMTFTAFYILNVMKSTNINSLAISWAKFPILSALTPLVLLSLAGLPPLTGFMPKWLIIQEVTKQGLPATATISALSALLSLYFYLRLSYAMTLTMSPNNLASFAPWRLPPIQTALPLAFTILLTLFLLPLTPSITAVLTR